MRYCRTCGGGFVPRRSFHYLCFTCWRLEAGENVGRPSGGYAEGWAAGYAAGRREAVSVSGKDPPPTRALDQRLLLQVIGLCHPDRRPIEHQEQANKVTARLLELREGVGR